MRSGAILWKNGAEKYLTDGSGFSEANSVFVENDNVYVVGREW
jgi:hypothetical protein